MKKSTGYITSAAMVGLLKPTTGGSANLVNVLTLAKQSGVAVQKSFKYKPIPDAFVWLCAEPYGS